MYKIGILGCGQIASVMAESIKKLPGHKVTAVASRTQSKAEEFAKKHCKSAKALGSYEELSKEDVDLIYIATPNNCHYDNAVLCIRNKKNVLVEKPFALNREQTENIFREAINHSVFVCEAMWTSFMPIHKTILGWIADGRIGQVKYISSNLGYEISTRERLVNPELGGGAYLDLGVYPTNLAVSILGEQLVPTSCYARRINTGVEKDIFYTLENEDRTAVATSYVTMCVETDKGADIVGDKGRIRIENINNYESATLFNNNHEAIETALRGEDELNGYALEVKACCEAIKNGRIQTAEMPWSKTTAIASIGDQIKSKM